MLMLLRKLGSVLAVALGLVVVTGCMDPQTKELLEELKSNQKKMLTEMENLKKAGGARPGRGGPRPGAPDPTKTYAVPVMGQQKGDSNALVTIIEVSDFQ